MLEIFAHSDLSHQLVLVAVHSRQLTNMGKDVLQSISQLHKRLNEMLYIQYHNL